jgi:F420-dependent oxidoreductase-like protein
MQIGIYISSRPTRSLVEIVAAIRALEDEGLHTAWLGQLFDFDALTVLAIAGATTSRIELGSWVVPSYPRHPSSLAVQALTVQAASANRLLLGVGVSHKVVIEGRLGLDYSKPLGHATEYLAVLDGLLSGERLDHKGEHYQVRLSLDVPPGVLRPPILLAALGPQMLRLAGRAADGAAIWLGSPRYLEEFAIPRIQSAAQEVGRPAPRIVCGLPIAISSDVSAARAAVAAVVDASAALPSYRAVLERGAATVPSDVAVLGNERRVRDQLEQLARIGVSDFNALVIPVKEDPKAYARTRSFLSEFARAPG